MSPPPPLSDAITQLNYADTWENYAVVLAELVRARLGIIVGGGLPEAPPGTMIRSPDGTTVASAAHPDGRMLMLACADRSVFVTRFERPFNAEVDFAAFVAIVLANPDCAGALINSASSEHSVVVPRADLARLQRGASPSEVALPEQRSSLPEQRSSWWSRLIRR